MTIKEYAVSRAISYEAVAKQVRNYKKRDLKKHITYQGRTAVLDDFAISFLDQHRQPKNIVVTASTEETQKELDRLKAQVDFLQMELYKKTDKINELLESQSKLIEDNTRNQVLLQIADKEREELEQAKQELNKYQRTIFGLYKKVD